QRRRGGGWTECILRTTRPRYVTFALIEGRGSTRIVGSWELCPDGLTRPVVFPRVDSGTQPFFEDSAALRFTATDGQVGTVRGSFAVFTDPAAADMSILGRDVINIFDLIVSRPRNEVLLLAPNHTDAVVP